MEIGRFDFEDRLDEHRELQVDVMSCWDYSLATEFIDKEEEALRIIAHLQQVFEL